MNAKRGFVPEDINNFSREALPKLRSASRHVLYLINEGYDLKPATTFVGNHFQLSERQRLAIMRSLATDAQLQERKHKQVSLQELAGQEVWIDGFNTIITLEVMYSRSILYIGMDGAVRDLAALRGTYKLISETNDAIEMIFSLLQNAGIRQVNILLDEPVSNSGRLKARIADIGEGYDFSLDIQILKDVDRTLYQKEHVITSDSIILDNCRSWVNLGAECLKAGITEVFRVWE